MSLLRPQPDHAHSRDSADNILKQRIASQHGAENITELHVGQVVRRDNCSASDGNVNAVQIGHSTQNEEPEDQKPSDVGCPWNFIESEFTVSLDRVLAEYLG